MRRISSDTWSTVILFAMLVIAAGPALLGLVPLSIPYLAWLAILVLHFVSIFAALWGSGSPDTTTATASYVGFAVAVVTSWALVLTSNGQSLIAVILVVVTSVSPYLIPVAGGAILSVLNIVVIGIAVAPLYNEHWIAEATAVLGFYLVIQIATLLGSASHMREQKARHELAEAHVELQTASAQLAESARANERLRISRELHDLIGHQLAVLTIELEAAKHRADGDAMEHIQRADGVARDLLSDVRQTVSALRSEPANLDEALGRVVGDIVQPRVSLHVEPGIDVSEDQTLLFLRTVQEILTNAIRHSDARNVAISVRQSWDEIILDARDDGRGARQIRLGNGLRGLRERVEEAGGTVEFDGAKGFRVTARIPA